jgi:hypothetical protein
MFIGIITSFELFRCVATCIIQSVNVTILIKLLNFDLPVVVCALGAV